MQSSFLFMIFYVIGIVSALPIAIRSPQGTDAQQVDTGAVQNPAVLDPQGYTQFLQFLDNYINQMIQKNNQAAQQPQQPQQPQQSQDSQQPQQSQDSQQNNQPIAHEAQDNNDQNQNKSSNDSGEKFSGEATYYTPDLGSCGQTNSESDLVVALNAPQYDAGAKGAKCGVCVMVNGADGRSVKAHVVDRCPGCKHGDLDLSPSAFNKIASLDDGRVKVDWTFTEC